MQPPKKEREGKKERCAVCVLKTTWKKEKRKKSPTVPVPNTGNCTRVKCSGSPLPPQIPFPRPRRRVFFAHYLHRELFAQERTLLVCTMRLMATDTDVAQFV